MYTRERRSTKIVHDFVDNLILRKKLLIDEQNKDGEHFDNQTIKTFLELLIENSNDTDKGYTDEELREETLALATAGSDTSAVGTCFAILLLSQHMDVQDKIYREIQEVLGDTDKTLEAEDLMKFNYLRAVIKETLRLYPPVPITVRYLKKDLELPTGITLPEGSNVVTSIWSIHRNPRHWGDDANVFNPDRFLPGKAPQPNAFMPFSYGPRSCPGYQYAMFSMSTTLINLLRRYRIKPASNYKYDENNPLRVSFEVMMIHVDNFSVQIEYRNEPNKNKKSEEM
ncbi:cytochrome P450 4X1-like [Melitaea cinxia]|uniref:cytochrome P450 4X1-like n=1 Tax=Melitaea cinxia TaxID=113334 RepID=UPI001E26FA9E|nr:cytochrome P450 4X1-like [Melitaea cinxia]